MRKPKSHWLGYHKRWEMNIEKVTPGTERLILRFLFDIFEFLIDWRYENDS